MCPVRATLHSVYEYGVRHAPALLFQYVRQPAHAQTEHAAH